MRPVERGELPLDENGEPILFKQYKEANLFLKERLGKYCSYCEMYIPAGLYVEHIQPKHVYPLKELDWDNFLLACCHCNSSKGKTDIIVAEYYLPHKDNTFLAFEYIDNGSIIPHSQLTSQQQNLALNSLKLFNLSQDTCSQNDPRLLQRREAWRIAKETYDDLQNGAQLRTVQNLIIGTGNWSVWMTVFQDNPKILSWLINDAFSGTCQQCFNALNLPISRH